MSDNQPYFIFKMVIRIFLCPFVFEVYYEVVLITYYLPFVCLIEDMNKSLEPIDILCSVNTNPLSQWYKLPLVFKLNWLMFKSFVS